jgi:hypothetical protein
VNLTTSYNLIDTWMLGKRWEEEVIQTKNEMIAFVQFSCRFQKLRVNLMDDLAIKQTVVQSYLEDCVEMSENLVYNYYCFSICVTFQFITLLNKFSDFSVSRSHSGNSCVYRTLK